LDKPTRDGDTAIHILTGFRQFRLRFRRKSFGNRPGMGSEP